MVDVLSVLIWVKTVCKGCQQTTKVGTRKECVTLCMVLLTAKTLKKLRTSKGYYWIKLWLSSIASVFIIGTSLKGKKLLSKRVNSFFKSSSLWHGKSRIRWPPLNVTILITHVRNCVLGVVWYFKNQHSQSNLSRIPSECQTVWIRIRPGILLCLVWVIIIQKKSTLAWNG